MGSMPELTHITGVKAQTTTLIADLAPQWVDLSVIQDPIQVASHPAIIRVFLRMAVTDERALRHQERVTMRERRMSFAHLIANLQEPPPKDVQRIRT